MKDYYDDYSAEEEQNSVLSPVSKEEAIKFWEDGGDVYINGILAETADELLDAEEGFSISAFQKEAQKDYEEAKKTLNNRWAMAMTELSEPEEPAFKEPPFEQFSEQETLPIVDIPIKVMPEDITGSKESAEGNEIYIFQPNTEMLEEMVNRICVLETSCNIDDLKKTVVDEEFEAQVLLNDKETELQMRLLMSSRASEAMYIPLSEEEKTEIQETIKQYRENLEKIQAEKANKNKEAKKADVER